MAHAHTTGPSINDNKSFEIGLFLSTEDARDVMPFIDMQRANVAVMYPAIDNPSFTVNRSGADADAAHGFRVASSITLMEVLA